MKELAELLAKLTAEEIVELAGHLHHMKSPVGISQGGVHTDGACATGYYWNGSKCVLDANPK